MKKAAVIKVILSNGEQFKCVKHDELDEGKIASQIAKALAESKSLFFTLESGQLFLLPYSAAVDAAFIITGA